MAHLNLFIHGCGHHGAAWRAPGSAVERLGDFSYYEQLALTAERGLLDAVFFADGHSIVLALVVLSGHVGDSPARPSDDLETGEGLRVRCGSPRNTPKPEEALW